MTYQQEWNSWFAPPPLELSPSPKPGEKAPSTARLSVPSRDGNHMIIAFLRHCGCPFAERDFTTLRDTASKYPSITCIAVSHSTQNSTNTWLEAVGGTGKVQVIVDEQREIYAKWGLGVSGWIHLAHPGNFWTLYKLGKEKGIWNRPTDSGSRWQKAGHWAVDENGVVRWGGPAARSDEVLNWEEAVQSVTGRREETNVKAQL